MIQARHLPQPLINLTTANIRHYNDLHRFQVVTAGRRSRKTIIGDRKILVDPERGALWQTEPFVYFLAAPTRPQAKAIFWERLKRDTKLLRTKKSETELSVTLLNGCIIQVVGLDKPERIEGQTDPPVKGIHITELGNCKPDIWGAHIRPVLSDTNGFGILDGVPEGMNFYYDIALYAAGGILPKTQHEIGAYSENPDDTDWSWHSWYSSDVLSVHEIEAAKRELDEKTFSQEYEGSFESYQGLCYYAFSKDNYRDCELKRGMNIDIGMDFNVDPMCAVEGHIINNSYYQHGETVLRNSNTFEMGQHLIRKYNLKADEDGILPATIYPDATGMARESNATMTDLQILRKLGFKVKARKSNPDQRDRVNSANSLMRPMVGEPRYYINPAECPNTIADFGKVQRLPDGRIDKETEEPGKPFVHISDAATYLIDYNFPIRDREIWSLR